MGPGRKSRKSGLTSADTVTVAQTGCHIFTAEFEDFDIVQSLHQLSRVADLKLFLRFNLSIVNVDVIDLKIVYVVYLDYQKTRTLTCSILILT